MASLNNCDESLLRRCTDESNSSYSLADSGAIRGGMGGGQEFFQGPPPDLIRQLWRGQRVVGIGGRRSNGGRSRPDLAL